MEEVKLFTHQHPLHRSCKPSLQCSLCDKEGWIYDGYGCSECRYFNAHNECAESPPEIDSPYHPEHPLKLLTGTDCYLMNCGYPMDCDCCAIGMRGIPSDLANYHCSICHIWVHVNCERVPKALDIEHPKAHRHSLTFLKERIDFQCHVCNDKTSAYPYACKRCNLFFHMECTNLSPEITHPSHPSHPIKFLTNETRDNTDGKCCLCGTGFQSGRRYHCSLCKFSVDMNCAKNPPPVDVSSLTTHEHKLTLLPIPISFTCNACGTNGDWSPYVCVQCYFVIHIKCIDLPRVININRHDHRISRTYCLGLGNSDLVCGVCRKKIDRSYGAYSCRICGDYAVHSRCATRHDVWDGKELDGKPKEIHDNKPFEVISDNLIKHFSHEHHLRLITTKEGFGRDASISCNACICPIYSSLFYTCKQCEFSLHIKCANLPRKKRHVMFGDEFTLFATYMFFHA